MAFIKIPEAEFPTLKLIADLDSEVFASLLAALKEAVPALSPEAFAQKISTQFAEPRSLVAILGTLFALYRLKDAKALVPEKLANAVSDEASEFLAEKREIFRERLKSLLEFDDSLGVTAKAFDVMTEHEHVFCSARILSDIRPVFAKNAESAAAAVIIHNLQIGFHDSGTGAHRELYIALDSVDLEELKQVIERAEKKNAALKSVLNQSGVPFLEA